VLSCYCSDECNVRILIMFKMVPSCDKLNADA
jgi:hypothetical protein